MNELNIFNKQIRTDSEGRYCLNDLHRAATAAGANKRTKEPGKFLASPQTKRLINILLMETTQNLGNDPVAKNVGGDAFGTGTYVVKELVYSYAMWISPEFHLQVIRAYDKQVMDEIDRLNGIQYRAIRAEMDYQHGMREASSCGKGLRKWRNDKPVKLMLLEQFRLAMQPALFPMGSLPGTAT